MKRTLLTTALLVGISGLATASTDGFVVESTAHPHDDEKTTTHEVWVQKISDGKHVYELRMEDGVYIVSVDGDKVPDELIKQNKDAVLIMEDDGGVRYEFDLSLAANGPVALHNTKSLFFAPSDQTDSMFEIVATQDGDNLDVVVESHPKVMLGIYSGDPGESLRQHLNIKGRAILVERVIDGLSADKAGIKDHDIIISIDGSDGISPAGLTKLLGEHEVGDEIKIMILRKGEKIKLDTKLFAYDANALGHTQSPNIGAWTQMTGDSKFPARVRVAPNTNRLFSPAVRELTHEKILNGLRESGISENKIREIEEQIRASLEENVWSSFGNDGRGGVIDLLGDVNAKKLAESRILVESMHQKAQAALHDAERMTLEFKDGQLLLKRHAKGLENHLHKLEDRLHESLPEIEEKLQDRLGDLEERLNELESVLDDRMGHLSDLIEHLIEKIDED